MVPEDERMESLLSVRLQPGLTWGLDPQNQRIVGLIDGVEAMRQAIYKLLATQRNEELVYSSRYGARLRGLVGLGESEVRERLEREITEALLYDDRVLGVSDFVYEWQWNVLRVTFLVKTTVGDLRIEKGVKLNV